MHKKIPILDILISEFRYSQHLVEETVLHLRRSGQNLIFVVLSHENSHALNNYVLQYWLQMLSGVVKGEEVRVCLGFQGRIPPHIEQVARSSHIEIICPPPRLFPKGIHDLHTGKGENLWSVLYHLYNSNSSQSGREKTIVITFDDDYILGHWLNQWLLAMPLLTKIDCGCRICSCLAQVSQDITMVKSGSPRLVLDSRLLHCIQTQRTIPIDQVVLTRSLSEEGVAQYERMNAFQKTISTSPVPMHIDLDLLVWAQDILSETISTGKLLVGGRTERKLRQMLKCSKSPYCRELNEFVFLLNGDHGADLFTWSSLPIGSGYLMEIVILTFAQTILSSQSVSMAEILLPVHAHIRKSDAVNMAMGQVLVKWLRSWIETVGSESQEVWISASLAKTASIDQGCPSLGLLPSVKFIEKRGI